MWSKIGALFIFLLTALTCIAAYLVVPEVRTLLGLDGSVDETEVPDVSSSGVAVAPGITPPPASVAPEASPSILPTGTNAESVPLPDEPTIPASVAVPTMLSESLPIPPTRSPWVVCVGTGTMVTSQNFTIGQPAATCHFSLIAGEFVVGDADRFEEFVGQSADESPCIYFLIRGPVEVDLAFSNQGGGDYYATGGEDEDFVADKLSEKMALLQSHTTCPERGIELREISSAAQSAATSPAPISSVALGDCWSTVWSFSPSSTESISTSLTPARSRYSYAFDTVESGDDGLPGSLRVETHDLVEDWTQDKDAWSFMTNLATVEATDGLYRIRAWMKMQNATQSHIAIVGRNAAQEDVWNANTNQIAGLPAPVLDGSYDWMPYERVFNPRVWSAQVETLHVWLNAGWSSNGEMSVTWFDNVELQYCNQ